MSSAIPHPSSVLKDDAMRSQSRLIWCDRCAWLLLVVLAAIALWQNSSLIDRAVRRLVSGPLSTPAGVCPVCGGRPSESRPLGGGVNAVDFTCGDCGERWLETRPPPAPPGSQSD